MEEEGERKWVGYWEEVGRDTGRKLGVGGEEGGSMEERGEVSRRRGGNG